MSFINRCLKFAVVLILSASMILSMFGCSEKDVPKASATKDEEYIVPAPKYNIGVILSSDSKDDVDAYNGFCSAFEDRDIEKTGFHHSMTLMECTNEDECIKAANDLVESKVDLIYAVGETAAVAAKNATDTIPVIFCSVADPIEAGLLATPATPDKNVTGVSDFTPCKAQMEFLRELYPEAKKVSAVYCATDAKSILISNMAKAEAEALGLEYESYPASNEHQLKITAENAAKDGDVIYLCEDELTLSEADLIFEIANENKTPVFSSTLNFFSEGAVATALPDYTALGYESGELALICLKNLKPFNEIVVQYPESCKKYVNVKFFEELPVDSSEVIIVGAVSEPLDLSDTQEPIVTDGI